MAALITVAANKSASLCEADLGEELPDDLSDEQYEKKTEAETLLFLLASAWSAKRGSC